MFTKPAWTTGARQGPIRRHKKIVFFACEGLVAVYDERSQEAEDYLVITPDDFKERAVAVGELGQRMAKGDQQWMRAEGREMLAAANDMTTTIKEAKHMGDPTDAKVQAFWARHRRDSTIRVNLSAGSDPKGYPSLPDVSLGPRTGRTAEAGVLLEDATRVHRKPRKKPRGGILLADDLL